MWKISFPVTSFEENLPNGVMYKAVYNKAGTLKNSDEYIVPKTIFFS